MNPMPSSQGCEGYCFLGECRHQSRRWMCRWNAQEVTTAERMSAHLIRVLGSRTGSVDRDEEMIFDEGRHPSGLLNYVYVKSVGAWTCDSDQPRHAARRRFQEESVPPAAM